MDRRVISAGRYGYSPAFLADSSESCIVGVRTSLIAKELEFGEHSLRCASNKK